MSRIDRRVGRGRRQRGSGFGWALLLALSVAAGAAAEERLYVQEYSPSRLLAWSFDGTSFHAEDPSPGTPEPFEPTYAGPQTIGGSDRWFLSGYWGPALALTVTDPATGQELPVVPGEGGGAAFFALSPDGKKVWGAGPNLTTFDLDPASATFLQPLPGAIALPTSQRHEGIAASPAGDRLYLASRTPGAPETTLRAFDVSTPAAPVLLGEWTVPPSAGGTGAWVELALVQFAGGDWLAIARRDLVLVPLAGGLPDVANRQEWYGFHPISGARRRAHAVWAQETPSGPRLFAATNSYSGVAWQNELLVFDLAQPLAAGPLHVEPVTAADATFDNEFAELHPSLSGDYLYLLEEGGEIAAHGYDLCKLRAYDVAALAAGLPGAELAQVSIDPAVNLCGAISLSVRDAPPAPPAGPAIADAVVDGAAPPNERLVVNDVARQLTITGSGLAGVTHAFLGLETLALVSVGATAVTATVPPLTPAGDPTLVLVDGAGALATFEGLRVVNPPQFLPGSRLYANNSPRNQIVEINGANANEVLSTFPTGQGPLTPSITADGRRMLVPSFDDGSVRAHSIVADPAHGWGWNQEIQNLYAGYYPREIEVRADGRRAYVNTTVCWMAVVDLEAVPPVLVDTDADPGTTDIPFFDGVDPAQHALQQGVTRIPILHDGDCLVTYASALSPDGQWLYLASFADPGLVVVHLGAHPDADFVDPATDITFLDVPGQPQFYPVTSLVVAPDGATLYWASNGESQVRVFAVDPLDGAVLTEQAPIALPGGAPEPWGIALSPDGGTLYVVARSSGQVHIFDLGLRGPARAAAAVSVDLPWRGAAAAPESPAGPAQASFETVALGGSGGAPVTSPDGHWLYVNSPSAGMIAIIDRRPGSPTLNQVLTTTGAGLLLGPGIPSPGIETPAGDPEPVTPAEGASIDYSNVTSGGSTTVTSSNVSSVAVPADFQVELPGGAPVYYDVTTDAAFSGPVTVCFGYDDAAMTVEQEANVRLLHEAAGEFVDVTTSLDTVGNVVCGVVESFSQFAQAIFAGAIAVDPPAPATIAEPAAGSSFVVRGTVAPTGSVSVALAAAGDCAISGGVTEVVLDSVNYLAGVVVGVDVVDDPLPESQEVCTITTAPADADDDQPAYEGYDASDVTLLVDDDDSTDLAIAKTDGVAAVAPGGQTTYTITLSNRGGVPVAGASFADPLPAGTSYASSGCSGGSNCAIAGGAVVAGSVDLAPGESATFTVTVDVDSGASGNLVNTATIDGFGGLADIFPGNDVASDTTRARDGDPPAVAGVGSLADTGDGSLDDGEVTAVDVTQILVDFDEPVRSGRATNPANYQLYRTGPDLGFETADCSAVASSDEAIAIDAASYASQIATLSVHGGVPLPDGLYRLRVCAGILDVEGNSLDGDGNGAGGDDFLRTFRVDRLPPTVESLGADFGPGYEPWSPGTPTNRTLYWLFVTFSEAVTVASGADGANFLVLAEGGTPGFQTVDCASGVAPEDAAIGFDGVGYDTPSRTAALDLTGPESDYLPHGTYRLLVCGSTSVEDLAGRKLDGNYDQTGGDDYVVDFTVDRVAPQPPPTLFSTTHGPFTWSQLATIGMRWQGAFDDGPAPATGIQGYDFVFTMANEDTDYQIDVPHGADPHTVLSPPLPDGLWTFRIRDFDGAWNVSPDSTAGPYFIDTTAPEPPASVASPSHDGGPSNDTTIDVEWGPGTDNLSGLDGYAWAFSASATAACDETLDGQEWASSATSAALAEGDWYFHLCARDNAGNWGAAGAYGPWTIDATRPTVTAIDSVAAADWSGGGAAVVDAALTQLLVGFDETMATSGPGSVLETGNWRLVEAGADGVVDTGDCGGLADDDVAAVLPAVQYDAGLGVAAVAVGAGSGLPAGSYRILACPALADVAGNALDGAGDGGGAEAWARDFTVVTTRHLFNPNLDGDLAGWMVSGPVPAEWTLGGEDAEGKPFSGAAKLATAAGAGATWYLEQCVQTIEPEGRRLSALARLTSETPGAPTVRAFLTWMDGPGCGGAGVALDTSPYLSGDSVGSWLDLAVPPVEPAPGAVSFWLTFEVEGGVAESYTVEIDRALYPEAWSLFADDFESGAPCRWTGVVGGPSCP